MAHTSEELIKGLPLGGLRPLLIGLVNGGHVSMEIVLEVNRGLSKAESEGESVPPSPGSLSSFRPAKKLKPNEELSFGPQDELVAPQPQHNKKNEKAPRAPRAFDLSTKRSRHVALRVSYDGETYGGFSENVGELYDNSVERALFECLVKVRLVADRGSCGYSRCGRTDKGVSAAGQVVSLRLRSAFPPGPEYDSLLPTGSESVSVRLGEASKTIKELDYCKMLNGVLPPEIRVMGWTPVTEEFSSRFSCTARVYRYFFVRRGLDLSKMSEALAKIVGDHDFRNMAKMDTEHVSNFRRLIFSARIVRGTEPEEEREQCHFEIKGQAFLWHMVRNIVQIMFFVGKGHESPSVVDDLFDIAAMPRKPNYKMADDFPLVLHRCEFNDLRLMNSPSNLWELQMNLEKRWERLALKASQLRNQIDSLGVENLVQAEDVWDFVKNSLGKWKRGQVAEMDEQFNGEDRVEMGKVSWQRALEMLKEMEGIVISGHKEPPHAKLCDRKVGLSYEEKLSAMTGKKLERYNTARRKNKEAAGQDKAFYALKQQQGSK